MSLLEDIQRIFGTDSLYEVFDVAREADIKDIKKAYYKKSLKFHPDRTSTEEDKENNTQIFQVLGQVHEVLMDKDRRVIYDETGFVEESGNFGSNVSDWDAYWRILFEKITPQQIESYKQDYQGSELEALELKRTYLDSHGSMEEILDRTLCSSYQDEERFREIIQKGIDDGELPAFKEFTDEPEKERLKRKKKAEKEAKEVEQAEEEKPSGSLEQMILARKNERANQMEGFFDQLEAKYAKPKKKSTKTAEPKAATKRKRAK